MTGTVIPGAKENWILGAPASKQMDNLCEVCLKPFSLSNIETHLEAGCGAEIHARYNITSVELEQKKATKKKQIKKMLMKKATNASAKGKRRKNSKA